METYLGSANVSKYYNKMTKDYGASRMCSNKLR